MQNLLFLSRRTPTGNIEGDLVKSPYKPANGKCPGKETNISFGRVLTMEHFYQNDSGCLELFMINMLGIHLFMGHSSLEKDTKTSNSIKWKCFVIKMTHFSVKCSWGYYLRDLLRELIC